MRYTNSNVMAKWNLLYTIHNGIVFNFRKYCVNSEFSFLFPLLLSLTQHKSQNKDSIYKEISWLMPIVQNKGYVVPYDTLTQHHITLHWIQWNSRFIHFRNKLMLSIHLPKSQPNCDFLSLHIDTNQTFLVLIEINLMVVDKYSVSIDVEELFPFMEMSTLQMRFLEYFENYFIWQIFWKF